MRVRCSEALAALPGLVDGSEGAVAVVVHAPVDLGHLIDTVVMRMIADVDETVRHALAVKTPQQRLVVELEVVDAHTLRIGHRLLQVVGTGLATLKLRGGVDQSVGQQPLVGRTIVPFADDERRRRTTVDQAEQSSRILCVVVGGEHVEKRLARKVLLGDVGIAHAQIERLGTDGTKRLRRNLDVLFKKKGTERIQRLHGLAVLRKVGTGDRRVVEVLEGGDGGVEGVVEGLDGGEAPLEPVDENALGLAAIDGLQESGGGIGAALEEPFGLVVDEVADEVGVVAEGSELLGERGAERAVLVGEDVGEVAEDEFARLGELLEGPGEGYLRELEVLLDAFVEVVVDADGDGVEAPALEPCGVDGDPGVPPVVAEGADHVGACEVEHSASASGLDAIALDEFGYLVGGGPGVVEDRVIGGWKEVEHLLHAVDEAMDAHA